MDIDEEEAVWDVVRDRINVDIESGEFTALSKALFNCFPLYKFKYIFRLILPIFLLQLLHPLTL